MLVLESDAVFVENHENSFCKQGNVLSLDYLVIYGNDIFLLISLKFTVLYVNPSTIMYGMLPNTLFREMSGGVPRTHFTDHCSIPNTPTSVATGL